MIEKTIIAQILKALPFETILIIAIVIVAIYMTLKVNKLVNTTYKERKQQHKCELVLRMLPCLTERAKEWLIDPEQNGGRPPQPTFKDCKNTKDTLTKRSS